MNEHGRLMDKDHFDSVFGVEQNKLRTEMRDDIAVRVLISLIEKSSPEECINHPGGMARAAYKLADAMLKVRGGE